MTSQRVGPICLEPGRIVGPGGSWARADREPGRIVDPVSPSRVGPRPIGPPLPESPNLPGRPNFPGAGK